MKNSSQKSEASRQKMVQAAAGAFREHGFGGVGVDGLAKAADFTSGAFYFHFKSKLAAFIAAVEDSLTGLRAAVEAFQEREGSGWLHAFASFYLGYKRTCGLKDACAVPVLTSEVERAGAEARLAYEAKLREVLDALAAGLGNDRERAMAVMAMLAGGAMLSRVVVDPSLSEEIGHAVQRAAEAAANPSPN